jgi:DNA-binding SARP family transcriptional activator
MRFSVLGPLLASADDGTPLPLRRPSQRSTLVVLLMYARQPPTRGLLIDALWGENAPRDAETALRVRIRDLRRALGGQDCLTTHQAGYHLVIEPGELDAVTFGVLATAGRAALDGGSPEDAARLLGQACSIWRDPPLVDFPDTPTMRLCANALLDQRREVQEWLIDARLALGQEREALPQIRAAVASDPLAEHPHVQLMLALYRRGEKSAALDAYSRLRELTTRELGQEPGPEARALLQQMLSDSPELKFRPRLFASPAEARPAWTPICQLPAPPPDFTGRVAAIETLARRMSATDLSVTVITGPPGVGKTALAVKAAHLASEQFPDGQLYAVLGDSGQARTALDVLGELLRSLGVSPTKVPDSLAARAALYRSVLAGRRVLVVADDADSAAQLRPLLPGTAGPAVIVTSSSRLADLEGASSLSLAGLNADEAVAFLSKVVGRERIQVEPDAAAAIAVACAGLPLALRIAGARLATNPAQRVADLADAMSDTNRLLAELSIGDLSVSRRLDTAWRALDPHSRTALRTLATAGVGDLPDSLVLSAASGAAAVAQALRDSSLLIQNPETGCYRIAPLAGYHAAAQLSASGV